MSGDRPRRPGWYPDQDDPTRVRHWTGRGWSGRHRSLPAWALSEVDVSPDGSWGSLQPTGSGPVLEGPVRPSPLPAATRGSLVERRQGVRTERLVRPPGGAGRPGGSAGPPPGRHVPTPGWAPARRPLMVFVALVAVAVLMMGATVAGVGRVTSATSSAVGQDAGFVARATSICEAGLRGGRPAAGSTAMTAPGDSSALVSSAEASSAAVGTVEEQLRLLPVNSVASAAVGDWLDDLGRYVVDEEQLALTLEAAGHAAGAAGAAGSGPTPAETAAMHVTADITQADTFAADNGLAACSLAPAPSSALVTVP